MLAPLKWYGDGTIYPNGIEKHQVKQKGPGFAATGLIRAFHVLSAMWKPREGTCDIVFLKNVWPQKICFMVVANSPWSTSETQLCGVISARILSVRGRELLSENSDG